jgi:hypothetical protein
MKFQENSYVGVTLYCAGRTDGQAGRRAGGQAGRRAGGQTDMTRLLATALRNCDIDFGRKYGFLTLINRIKTVKIIIY